MKQSLFSCCKSPTRSKQHINRELYREGTTVCSGIQRARATSIVLGRHRSHLSCRLAQRRARTNIKRWLWGKLTPEQARFILVGHATTRRSSRKRNSWIRYSWPTHFNEPHDKTTGLSGQSIEDPRFSLTRPQCLLREVDEVVTKMEQTRVTSCGHQPKEF